MNLKDAVNIYSISPLAKLICKNCFVPGHRLREGPLRTEGICNPSSYPGGRAKSSKLAWATEQGCLQKEYRKAISISTYWASIAVSVQMCSNHCQRWRWPGACAEETKAGGVEFEVILGPQNGSDVENTCSTCRRPQFPVATCGPVLGDLAPSSGF